MSGNSVTLNCTADGHPLPVITWWKDGVQLNETMSKYSISVTNSSGFRSSVYPGILQVESDFTVLNLTRADSGNYTCRAQSAGSNETELQPPYTLVVTVPGNEKDKIKDRTQEGVIDKREITRMCYSFSAVARINGHSLLNVTEEAKSNFSLRCSAIGFPTPTIVWRNSTAHSIASGGLHNVLSTSAAIDLLIVTNSSLEFVDLRISQEGEYCCCAADSCSTFVIQVLGINLV